MFFRSCILAFWTIGAVSAICARPAGPVVSSPEQHDTLETHITERNRRLYDSLEMKSRRRAVPHLLYRLLIRRPQLDTTANGRVLDESRMLEPFEGKTVGEVRIEREQVFAPDGNWLERTGNKLHALTRERIIRRDLLFRPGDRFDPDLVVRSQQLLRSRSYISDTRVEVVPDTLDTTRVDIVLHTRDSWTITLDAGLRSEGRTMVGISDVNIFGTGNKLKLETNFSRRDFSYGGNMVEYEIPNLFGSFFQAKAGGGTNFYEENLSFELSKEFLRPTDYEVGIAYSDVRSKYYLVEADSSDLVKVRNLNLWAGRSLYIRPIQSSFFMTFRYNYARFSERPPVRYGYNPAFHDHDLLLSGFGLYREKFLSASMIYGFGTKEYFATGYKAELVTGYSWGEFNDALYLGMSFRTGAFRAPGFLMGGITLGSYIDHRSGMWSRSAVDVDLRWFSNLFILRRNRIRQFLALRYTQGWNRQHGSDESILFTRQNGLRALDAYTVGTNRMLLNTETVVFTPFQPLGFRFACFGFFDLGLIGYSPNIFKNDFYTSFGAGLRIKNERLIFSEIQIRLGIAFGKRGLVESEYFRLSNASRMEHYRFRPPRPELVGFE
ncbi:MAG: hypothetical protein K2K30_09280 [Alistipes sp.]|nr:hypothetical protein [Alistipes sp.]